MNHCLAALFLLFCAASARAQLGIYGMASAGRLSGYNSVYASPSLNTAGSFWAQGGTLGIYDNFLHLGPIKLGGDVRGFLQKSSNSNNAYGNELRGGLVGLRLAASAPLIPFKPYVQAELGGASTNFGQNSSRTGGLIYQVQFGADFTVFPHIDVRAEYGVGKFTSLPAFNAPNDPTLQQLGVGAVGRF